MVEFTRYYHLREYKAQAMGNPFSGKHLSGKEKHYSKKSGHCYPCAMSCASESEINKVLREVAKTGVKIENGKGMTDLSAMKVMQALGWTFVWGYHPTAPMLVTVRLHDEYHAIARNPDGTWCCNRSGHRLKFDELRKRLAEWLYREDGVRIKPADIKIIQHISVWPIDEGDGYVLEETDIDDFLDNRPDEYARREREAEQNS